MGTKIDKTNLFFEKPQQSFPFQSAITEEKASIFDEVSNKKWNKDNSKNKKILLGVGIGTAIAAAVGVGLFITNVRKPGTISNNIANKLINNTNIGRKLKDSINYAKEASATPMEKVADKGNGLLDKIIERFTKNGLEIMDDTISDKSFANEIKDFVRERILGQSSLTKDLICTEQQQQRIKDIIELSGVGPTKFAQVISSDAEIMTKLDAMFPDLAKAIRSTRTDCSFSRTIEQAVEIVGESFKGKGYVIEKELGAGTIGATYLAKTAEGKKVVIKLLKEGVSAESLEKEKGIISDIILKIFGSTEDAQKAQATIDGLYKNWIKEVDFKVAAENSRKLLDKARRFSVSNIIEVAKDGKAMVIEMAEGIRMDKLLEILKDYKLNPQEFHTKYAELIEVNPWLANPEKVLKGVSDSILKAFDEQFLFMKKGSRSIMHADPHTGNFFITADKTGKLIPNFIDTDNCVIRTCQQLKSDLSFFVNYFVGNSRKLAEYLVNQCDCSSKDKAMFIAEISKDIRKLIFEKKANITSFEKIWSNLQTILQNHGLTIASENATAIKAEIQFMTTITETANLAGRKVNIFQIIKDVPRALFNMIKAGVNPTSCVKDAGIFAVQNKSYALGNLLQFLMV